MSDVGIAINQIQRVTPIVTGYLLGYIAAMPLLGRASDRFGRKMLLQVSLAGFAIGSVVTALSTDLMPLVIGRVIQGAASGALLPVTLALAADLWSARNRAGGARRYRRGAGAGQRARPDVRHRRGMAAPALAGRVLGQRASGGDRDGDDPFQPCRRAEDRSTREKVDVVGGVLLAITLGLVVVGMYNPAPDGKQVLPRYGLPLLIGALVAAVAFFVWERFAKTRLIEPAGVHFRPFLAALGASLTAGAALMVTLVNVELFGQGVLGQDQNQAAGLLVRFLIALPIGALLGGWIATKVGDRAVACVGHADRRRRLLPDRAVARRSAGRPATTWASFTLPVLDTDLAHRRARAGPGDRPSNVCDVAGGALGPARHRLRSRGRGPDDRHAGGHRGPERLGPLPVQSAPADAARPGGDSLAEKLAGEAARYRTAFAMQYGEMFGITAIVCIVGAILALFISGRNEHADEPEVSGPGSTGTTRLPR